MLDINVHNIIFNESKSQKSILFEYSIENIRSHSNENNNNTSTINNDNDLQYTNINISIDSLVLNNDTLSTYIRSKKIDSLNINTKYTIINLLKYICSNDNKFTIIDNTINFTVKYIEIINLLDKNDYINITHLIVNHLNDLTSIDIKDLYIHFSYTIEIVQIDYDRIYLKLKFSVKEYINMDDVRKSRYYNLMNFIKYSLNSNLSKNNNTKVLISNTDSMISNFNINSNKISMIPNIVS